jgi:hypothetical protein
VNFRRPRFRRIDTRSADADGGAMPEREHDARFQGQDLYPLLLRNQEMGN